jgi:DNA-directed RNA polymerases I and III subunit RPAC2
MPGLKKSRATDPEDANMEDAPPSAQPIEESQGKDSEAMQEDEAAGKADVEEEEEEEEEEVEKQRVRIVRSSLQPSVRSGSGNWF